MKKLRMLKFMRFLDTKERLTGETFRTAYSDYGLDGCFGLYHQEAAGIYSALHDKDIKTVAEVGRGYACASLYLYTCFFPDLKKVLSLDIATYKSEASMKAYLDFYGIEHQILTRDSTIYDPGDTFWDFVFIDGGHTGEIVAADIQVWKDKCKYIGFHDYSNKKGKNKHKRHFPDIVEEIGKAIKEYGWKKIGTRGRSEIVLETGNLG